MAKTEKETRVFSVRAGSKKREIAIGRIVAFRNYSKDIHFIYGGKCAICGWRVSEQHHQNSGSYGNEIHHIIPVKNNGTNDFSNLIPLCPNHHKQADIGVLSVEEIRKFQLKELDADAILKLREEKMLNNPAENLLDDAF